MYDVKGVVADNLNTSHVILYQESRISIVFMPLFKYISCYSLSRSIEITMLLISI